jgi:hypothetical protein
LTSAKNIAGYGSNGYFLNMQKNVNNLNTTVLTIVDTRGRN